MSFTASGVTVGLGFDSDDTISLGVGYTLDNITANAYYAQTDVMTEYTAGTLVGDPQVFTPADNDTTADGTQPFTWMLGGKNKTMGMDVSYTIGASTLTLVYAKHDLAGASMTLEAAGNEAVTADTAVSTAASSSKAYGLNITHDLGGGAKVVAGFGIVPGETTAADTNVVLDSTNGNDLSPTIGEDQNKASVGLQFSF